MKKDLRLRDHLPLFEASRERFLPIFLFEPSVSCHYDFDLRHWRFQYQSLLDLKDQGLEVALFYGEALEVFLYLLSHYGTLEVYSHQETGNGLTYQRDLDVAALFKEHGVLWREYQNNMVVRGLKNRTGWEAKWIKVAKAPQIAQREKYDIERLERHPFALPNELCERLATKAEKMLVGGESVAHRLLADFLDHKVEKYWGSISYPEKSRYYCSWLSSYITYGNLSIRQIYQAADNKERVIRNKMSVNQFKARLKWHCHFIQKLEMEPRIEFENLNKAFNGIRQKKDKKLIKAWKEGMTGYPLVDAAMRCVQETGVLNFRLRSTVASFLTHLLWQPWQAGAPHLARMFLDYEPGIHFSQFQMQAGTTGVNMIRIYNPIKQSKEKDKNAEFIKRWVPELKNLPLNFIHEPWTMTEMDMLMHEFRLGVDYPYPIVDFEKAYKYAQEKLWQLKNSEANRHNAKIILQKHTTRRGRKRA